MNSSANPIANGNANGIGNRLIGLQPPLSPPPTSAAATPTAPVAASVPSPAPAPVAAVPASPAPAPSTENLLVRFGLLTTEQVEEALRDQRGSGKHVAQIAIERGWVTREQLAQLVTQPPPTAAAAEPAPAPAPEPEPQVAPPTLEVAPEPVAAPAPAPAPTPPPAPAPAAMQPAPAVQLVARVFARLSTGDRVEIAVFGDLGEARARAEQVVRELQGERPEWPCFGGRFVRPEAIVSLDVEATPA